MNVDELANLVLEEVKTKPKQKAKDIAHSLNTTKKLVNHCLYSVLTEQVQQDAYYQWSISEKITDETKEVAEENMNTIEVSDTEELSNEVKHEVASTNQELSSPQINSNFEFESLQAIRNRLLDLTARNRLLNFKHGRSGFIRVIDEMPDQLAENILEGNKFTFLPVAEPLRKELIEHGYISIDEDGKEHVLKQNPNAKEWAKILGLDTNYELPNSITSSDSKHNDTNIQSLLYPRELEAQLRNIRSKANTAIEETGANILYLAFGFLEWFEDDNSGVARQAPLYLIPVKVDRASLNKDLGTYTYTVEYTGEDIISNLSLREKLKHDFSLELPNLEDEVLPEEYFKLIESNILRHKPKWQLKRFASLSMFDFGKLLMYLDLDPERWPQGEKNIQHHPILKKFFAKEGAEDEDGRSGFGSEYLIDKLDDVHNLYPLIDDADSSQHSALIDAIEGKNLVIEGPPGSGKSQTITNLIAAALAQGKKVLFVAEKMAALQVVKSRLERAGLGDFCLELHSHKTQKKSVYENIARRKTRQNAYRYPSTIDLDIQMYEKKKQALSEYADLINSKWKNTGRSIHQIFATATRYRAEFPDIALQDIQAKHIDGASFDEASSRRTTDELKRYADVFKEVKNQLGFGSELSEHPWFGVYNKTIQVFDSDAICEQLTELNALIKDLEQAIEPTSKQIGSIDSVQALEQILADSNSLPSISGNEHFPALKNINPENTNSLLNYIKQYQSALTNLNSLKQHVQACSLKEGTELSNAIDANNYLKKLLKNKGLKLSQAFTHLQELKDLKAYIDSLVQDISTVKEQDNTLTELLPNSHHGFEQLQQYLEHIQALDITLLQRRHQLFDNELLDKELDDLAELLSKITPLHRELGQYLNLDNLPNLIDLKEINELLSNTGFFSFFNSHWRAAKAKLMQYALGLKPKLKTLIPLLPKLISYKEYYEQLHKNNHYQSLLQHEFKGIDTQIDEISQLRTWYKNVRNSYGVGFGQSVAFANSLFSLNGDIFKGLQHLASSKSLNASNSFFELYAKLGAVFTHIEFEDKDRDLAADTSIATFINLFEKHIQALQSSFKEDLTIELVSTRTGQIQALLDQERQLNANTIAKEVFDETTELSLRVDSQEQLTKIQDTTDLAQNIAELKSELIRSYLINHINAETLSLLNSNLQKIPTPYSEVKTAFNTFSERVELDESSWYQGTQGKFALWHERNLNAISQPRWLSTWVDFIRIRSSLSDAGLENLLRYTEQGSLNLDDIEAIYIYSVFDTLSREVLNEHQELAFHSGADQNSLRKQFRDYDNKLKKLQQEKIAHQVATTGEKQTIAGRASGKVSTYTEMGLIEKEISKKTRHVPIRQLIKRAGKSLVELKPCFMMGPHSVAQYLEPGLIEFDLVVMDEASQIKPEDALGTIARGKQLVVVGDPKQLPPTSFFDKSVANDDEDVTAIEQSESILEVSFPMFNARRLRWHYRSRHESLIAFSNQEFYDNNLVVFPSPSSKSDEFGIKFTHVKSGRFVNQHNIEEAKVIAQAVRKHLLHHPNESLGVVAMSAKQREQIERCVEELSKDDSQFRDALAENSDTEEPLFLKNLENVQGDERDVIYISCTYGPQEAGAAQMPQRFGPINSAAGGRRLNVLFTRSKKRMHVFSSMTEGHILANESSSPGVKALKSFLSFAQTGKLQQQKFTGKQPDSDFEISVMNALKLEGFNCVPQVGVAGYFIDLAVQDPGQPGRYLMGIECDGATYHSAKSARDRDRLRQSVLESLGWNIKRIWSTDWFKNPQAQLKPIIEALHQLKTESQAQTNLHSEIEEIDELISQENQLLHKIDDYIQSSDSLELKLEKYDQEIIGKDEIPMANRLLRPAMLAALCEFKPITKNEFLEVIPNYLRTATAKEHGQHLEQVLNIIAESEEELA